MQGDKAVIEKQYNTCAETDEPVLPPDDRMMRDNVVTDEFTTLAKANTHLDRPSRH